MVTMPTSQLCLDFDVIAKEARRQVNRQVVTELGTGLIARDPELVIAGHARQLYAGATLQTE